jgi:hypothetical protein
MTRYISNPDNLKLMMNMLRDSSRNIQFEAFHVFKVFVANPDKPAAIHAILCKNKEKVRHCGGGLKNEQTNASGLTSPARLVTQAFPSAPFPTLACQILERFPQRPGRGRTVYRREGVCHQADQ